MTCRSLSLVLSPLLLLLQAVHQTPAVLGIALIAMGEPLGAQMASRMLEHLLQYGEPPGAMESCQHWLAS
jgi:hypothetical protein